MLNIRGTVDFAVLQYPKNELGRVPKDVYLASGAQEYRGPRTASARRMASPSSYEANAGVGTFSSACIIRYVLRPTIRAARAGASRVSRPGYHLEDSWFQIAETYVCQSGHLSSQRVRVLGSCSRHVAEYFRTGLYDPMIEVR